MANEAKKPETAAEQAGPQFKSFAEFLEQCPPDVMQTLPDVAEPWGTVVATLQQPELQMHCTSDRCNGIRVFYQLNEPTREAKGEWTYHFIRYVCRNCRERQRIFALAIRVAEDQHSAEVQKLGEIPTFGPPTPAKVISLIGTDRETFLRGRRAEINGLGIGAFAYYRRVVENQKGRIITEMRRVAERLGADKETLDSFDVAAKETQFSKAIDIVKAGIPKSLLIEGQNPLSLLHKALSDGMHDQSDEHCLRLARSIRLVLAELAERMSNALKDNTELKNAVADLLNVKATKQTNIQAGG